MVFLVLTAQHRLVSFFFHPSYIVFISKEGNIGGLMGR